MIIVVSLGMMAVVATVAAAGLVQVVSGNVFAARDRRFRSFVDLQRLWGEQARSRRRASQKY